MLHHGHFWRPKTEFQQTFGFIVRSRRHERRFKWVIFLTTLLTVAGILGGLPKGRYAALLIWSSGRRAAGHALGVPVPRSEVDGEWTRYRLQGVTDSRRALFGVYDRGGPGLQKLMRYAKMDPEHGLLRWGNFHLTLLLPSTIFAPDDTGRSYQLRPCTEAVWLRNVSPDPTVLMFFLVPDGPGLKEAMQGTTAIRVDESRQTTNSWGLRGPEPDLEAPLRGLVLGDSYMQGLFIGDDHTPPECLGRYLHTKLKTRTSMLNTGHLGYSPEQYYHTLRAFADRFRPHFVVVSFFANDFGDLFEALGGKGDWEEARYWLEKIAGHCRSRNWPCLFVAVPDASQLMGLRKAGNYPGKLASILEVGGPMLLNPIEAFVDKNLDVLLEGTRRDQRPHSSRLFNEQYNDGHFSARGSEVWASAVGERLVLLLKREHVVADHQTSSPSRLRKANPGGQTDRRTADLCREETDSGSCTPIPVDPYAVAAPRRAPARLRVSRPECTVRARVQAIDRSGNGRNPRALAGGFARGSILDELAGRSGPVAVPLLDRSETGTERDQRRLAPEAAVRYRFVARQARADVRRVSSGDARIVAVRGAGPRSRAGTLGKPRPDGPLAGDRLRGRRHGCSYRFRASMRSIWVRNFPVKGPVKAYFQVLDLPELTELVKGTGAQVVDGSVQTTNSWGLRGPEPDLTATWRGIVLGDSYMQGLFVGDRETPTECLKRDLKARLDGSVEILNTGHLGYSPEQYYYTLLEYAQRFPPRFVVISLFANDFGGDLEAVLEGKGDWEEGCYWLAEIRQYCFSRRITCLFVPAPWAAQLDDARSTGFYPGLVTNYLRATAQEYFDPIADFVNAQLALSIEAKDQVPGSSPLFNGRIGDGHFSARGSELWAAVVGRRLGLLLQLEEASREAHQRKQEGHARPTSAH